MPHHVVQIIQTYFDGFMIRFSIKTYTTKWVFLEVGIAMGCAVSPFLLRTIEATSNQRKKGENAVWLSKRWRAHSQNDMKSFRKLLHQVLGWSFRISGVLHESQ